MKLKRHHLPFRPTVSVVLRTWNLASRLGKALEHLLAQDAPPHEIVVVDNNID